ncbi:efflux RND transporter permease subunit [Paludisphaera mucosa]|uniref:Efflux RND transporter permease subunit n=1 Tax=Paludisphaera mucosa TaxID=3030827 RepID=A0ABT6FFD5_9BACT|nr:efflux RND transporter permease subunit [Paludisphaera mucosa]MDG3006100.1 efflux RND transporter permease subunit [Paludisphaera mucosa]
MNPIIFALRRPVTVLMLMLALAIGGLYSLYRMQKDIFPSLNQPVLYVVHSYGGMDPKQIEGLVTNVYETFFQYISGLEHVESRSLQSMVVMKLYFQPGTDMAEATANTVAYSNKAVSIMPVGSQPPFLIRLDAGSLPVGYLVLNSETKSIGEIQDMAMYRVRPLFASLPGTMSPPPFGGNIRAIVINLDPDRLRSYNLSPQDIVDAIDRGNYASPSGNVTIKDQMTVVPANTMVLDPQELAKVPLKLGQNVYIRDVGSVSDSTDIPTGYALVNGRKSVYMPVVKRADASTLNVVNEVKANVGRFQAALPEDVKISFEFDESPIVHRAIESVGVEGALGAGLTGLMVLLFLRDIRSVIVVVLNIPLALLGSVIVLDLTGNTINIMTLGGLALAIGILVDEATVEVENIHTQMEHTPSIARAVRQGNLETAVPRLLALLCILSVFIPSFIMQGAVRELFVPLSLAVGASMITSYLLSSTLVPVLSVWLLSGHEHDHVKDQEKAATETRRGLFARVQGAFERVLEWAVAHRIKVVTAYLVVTTAVVVLVGSQLGRELFPRVNAGQFQMRVRPPEGTNFELTRQVAEKSLDVIAEEAGPENVAITMGYVGAIPPQFTVNLAYQWSRGPDDSMLRVGLKSGSGIDVFELQERLRKSLPEKIAPWFRDELKRLGVADDLAEDRASRLVFAFEPGDLISETMSLGSPAPIEVVVTGRDLSQTAAFMDKIYEKLEAIPTLRDLQIQQTLHYPTVQVAVDRERAGLSGITAHDIGDSLIAATYSSRYTSRNYWRDDVSGTSYQVQVQVPPIKMTEATDVALIPMTTRSAGGTRPQPAQVVASNPEPPLLLRDVATVMRGNMPGEIDRYNMRRYLSVTANVEGEDLGRAIGRVEAAIKAVGKPPRGVEIDMRGQVKPMQQMFTSLQIGLGVAVLVILIMLTAYFQSFLLALTAVASVPAVLMGVVLALYATNTTLNIESFMGAIMAVGVAVSNAILLVSFADRHRREEHMEPALAAETAAKGRLRPILMTSCAMISGMIPMSLGLEEGSEQNAPLGRAVMGGMAMSTFAALLVIPSVFTLLMAWARKESPSLDPDDPESPHYSPEPPQHHAGHAATTSANGGVASVNGRGGGDHPQPDGDGRPSEQPQKEPPHVHSS